MTSRSPLASVADIWRAKLSRAIAVSVFISIVIVEVGIFIPSLGRQKQEQIDQMAALSQTASEALNQSKENDETPLGAMDSVPISPEEIEEKLERNLAANPHLVGIVIYGTDGQPLGQRGEVPDLGWDSLDQWKEHPFQYQLSPDLSRLDIAWPESSDRPYILIMRHDFSKGQTALGWFILRVAGLVVIISLFVTGVTLVVVYRMVVGPILQLRQDLEGVAVSLDHEGEVLAPLCCESDRQDELGDVQRAFDAMYATIHREIENRRQAELQSDQLLRNILPVPIADRLKQGERSIAERFDNATVLFADLVGFTTLAARLSPGQLVEILNQVFSRFDQLADRYDLEKIKTIGDAYMVVGGVPMTHRSCGVTAIAEMAIAMLDALEDLNQDLNLNLQLRIGIHHGPVVAGVIGLRKFIYDLWGDTVNVASRMESHGAAGRIQTTDTVYQILKNDYGFEERGTISVKGRGEMRTYWLIKRLGGPAPLPEGGNWHSLGSGLNSELNPELNSVSTPLEQP